jgi:hypothetical protein
MLRWCSETGPVDGHHLDGGHEHAGGAMVPLHFDQTLARPAGQRSSVGAVGPVHRYPPAPCYESDDLVARDRSTAARQTDHHVVQTFDIDADRRALARAGGDVLLAGGDR